MDTSYQLGMYLHLSQAAQRRGRPLVRDRMLILAGVVAADRQLDGLAEYCRRQVISHNPGHMLQKWPSIPQALFDPEFLTFIHQLRRRYSIERSEQMLLNLGLQVDGERETYFSDLEYAAAILRVDVSELQSEN